VIAVLNKEDWITSSQAAKILTANSGHNVSDVYVRELAARGKFQVWTVSRRTKLYWRKDVEQFRVKRSNRQP